MIESPLWRWETDIHWVYDWGKQLPAVIEQAIRPTVEFDKLAPPDAIVIAYSAGGTVNRVWYLTDSLLPQRFDRRQWVVPSSLVSGKVSSLYRPEIARRPPRRVVRQWEAARYPRVRRWGGYRRMLTLAWRVGRRYARLSP